MGKIIVDDKLGEVERRGQVRKKIVPLLTILLVVAISVGLFLYRDRVAELGYYGYPGAFLVGLVSNASVILPLPGIVVLFALGAALNPVLIGLTGATGGIIGEMTGFMAGYSGREMVQREGRAYIRAENWMRRWGGWAVFAFAAVPLPVFDVAGVVAGVLRYPIWKFLLIGWVGKSIKYIFLVLAGAWGWEAMLSYFG